MKTAIGIARVALSDALDSDSSNDDEAWVNRLAADIEARDAEVRAETIEAADPGCDCVPGYGQHPECKGARDAAKRIRSLTEKSKP